MESNKDKDLVKASWETIQTTLVCPKCSVSLKPVLTISGLVEKVIKIFCDGSGNINFPGEQSCYLEIYAKGHLHKRCLSCGYTWVEEIK